MNREEWTYKPMGEVGTFLRGKSILKSDFVEKGMPCIHYGQVHTKFGVSVDKYLSEISVELYRKSVIASPGDTIIAITSEDLDGSCKSTDWIGNCNVAVSAHAAVYKHNFVPKFIPYYLRSHSFYVEKKKYARGFKVMEIKPSDLAKIPVPIPSTETQNFIVSELDALNDSITMLHQQVKDLDALAQSLFYDMFGEDKAVENKWEKCCVGDIYKFQYGKGNNIPEDKGDYPCYGSNGIVGHHTEYNSENAPIIGHIGAYAGIVNWGYGKHYVTYNGVICNLKDKRFNPIYGFFLLKSQDYLNMAKRGGAQPFVSYDLLENPKVFIPPVSLQNDFSNIIIKLEESKSFINKQVNELQTLLASRMQYWFD